VYDIVTEKTADILLIHAGDVKARQLSGFLESDIGDSECFLLQIIKMNSLSSIITQHIKGSFKVSPPQ
jgi:hypothetical protein